MLKTIALAGVTAALVIGSIAVAQTATTPNTDPNANGGAMSSSQNGSASAPAAGQ